MKITCGFGANFVPNRTFLRNKCLTLQQELKFINMDANSIIQIISSLGFPIVMCGALFWYMVKQREAHQEETEHLKDTIAENTKVLAELTTLIKVLTDEKER